MKDQFFFYYLVRSAGVSPANEMEVIQPTDVKAVLLRTNDVGTAQSCVDGSRKPMVAVRCYFDPRVGEVEVNVEFSNLPKLKGFTPPKGPARPERAFFGAK